MEYFCLQKKRRKASKTPSPPGAVGITKPRDHDKEKTINRYMMLRLLVA